MVFVFFFPQSILMPDYVLHQHIGFHNYEEGHTLGILNLLKLSSISAKYHYELNQQ